MEHNCSSGEGRPDDSGEVEEYITVDVEDYEVVLSYAEAHGIQADTMRDRNFVDPVTVTLAIFGSALAVSAVAQFAEQRRGGQVVDMRPDAKRQTYRTKDLLYGYVQIIATDGTVTIEVKEPKGMFGQVLDALQLTIKEAHETNVNAASALAREAVGNMATVRIE